MRRLLFASAVIWCVACTTGQQADVVSTTPSAVSRDSSRLLVPAGYGSLKQEDIAIRVARGGLQVQAIPLDETIIRVLSPDSYRALREQLASRRPSLDSLARRTGLAGECKEKGPPTIPSLSDGPGCPPLLPKS